MEHIKRVVVLIFSVCILLGAHAQSLPDSKRESKVVQIYKIGHKPLRHHFLKDRQLTDKDLGEWVASFPSNADCPELKRGNYVKVMSIENNINFDEHLVDDLIFQMIRSDRFQLFLYNSSGKIITDAIVKQGSKQIPFDPVSKTYQTKQLKDGSILEINNQGVYHYLEISHYNTYSNAYGASAHDRFRNQTRNIWRWITSCFNPSKKYYSGFIAFSKPKYKPGETIKLKGYIISKSNKPYEGAVDIHLKSSYPNQIDTVIAKKVQPYRPGMFTYEFKLNEESNIELDRDYFVELQPLEKRNDQVTGRFKYEEYELQNIALLMTMNKSRYRVNDSIAAHLSVRDANDQPVYGGQAELFLLPANCKPQLLNQAVFVPDTLWRENVSMEQIANKTVFLPDSIFLKGIMGEYELRANYFTADGERVEQSKIISVDKRKRIIDFSLKEGQLFIQQLCNNLSEPTTAKIVISDENGDELKTDSVRLPYTMPIPWWGNGVEVETPQCFEETDFKDEQYQQIIDYTFCRENDSVKLVVRNPSAIPFWYEVYRGKELIASGRTDQLDYKVKNDSLEGYSMQLSYFLGENNCYHTEKLPYIVKNLSIDVQTNITVFPGQKSEVTMKVTDLKGQPVNNVDITAYAHTTKFGEIPPPYVPFYGSYKMGKNIYEKNYENEELTLNDSHHLNRDLWSKPLQLDSIAYYHFLYPEVYFRYAEPTKDGVTEVLPYVVNDGLLQGVSMLWIDNRLFYTSLTGNQNAYGFRIEPGRHQLVIRTNDRLVTVANIDIPKGVRTILSFNAAQEYDKQLTNQDGTTGKIVSKILKRSEQRKYSKAEIQSLSSHLITIEPIFGELQLSNKALTLPGIVRAGDETFLLNLDDQARFSYNHSTIVGKPILTGPFPKRYFSNGMNDIVNIYADSLLLSPIQMVGGNQYSLYPGYQMVTPWKDLPFSKRFNIESPTPNFRPIYLTPELIRQRYMEKLKELASGLSGRVDAGSTNENKQNGATLNLSLANNSKGKSIKPLLYYITRVDADSIFLPQMYYGNTNLFRKLPVGKVRLSLILTDSIAYSFDINLQPKGNTFLNIDVKDLKPDCKIAQEAMGRFYQLIKPIYPKNPLINGEESVAYSKIDHYYQGVIWEGQHQIVSGVVRDTSGEPITGALVKVVNGNTATITNIAGEYSLKVQQGEQIQISFVGCKSELLTINHHTDYNVTLEEDSKQLNETVVLGFGSTTYKALSGKVQGLDITNSTLSSRKSQLIVVDGKVYDGELDSLNPDDILSTEVIKDASAVAIYGSIAAGGVIMIKTKNSGILNQGSNEYDEIDAAGLQPMRHNFSDEAFWQPTLRTDQQGKARFEVTYPDDITSWKAHFIAIGRKKQMATATLKIRSFKPLLAQLSLPRFVISGDCMNAVGRITNHQKDSITLVREIISRDLTDQKSLTLGSSHIDNIPIKAEQGDSLSVSYSLKTKDDYFDGEKRTIPIFKKGLLQTSGDFKILTQPGNYSLAVDKKLGEVTVHAETTTLETFRREIEKVKSYPYDCNEQMASKVKVLLAKKQLEQFTEGSFKDERVLTSLINKLCKNQNEEGLWGWWSNQSTTFWISQQVISTLLDAKKAGYRVKINKKLLIQTLQKQLDDELKMITTIGGRSLPSAKCDLLERLIILKHLMAPINYSAYFRSIDAAWKSCSIADKLKTMETLVVIEQKEQINRDSLMACAQHTLLGSLFFGEPTKAVTLRMNRHPQEGVTEQTLTGYRLLKALGGSDKELADIRNYLFETRCEGGWENTYQASRIISTLLHDQTVNDPKSTDAVLFIGGKQITQFPYTGRITVEEACSIHKTGKFPLFVTAYQRQWNAIPSIEKNKGFTVNSFFTKNGTTVNQLKMGNPIQLEVVVEVTNEANYVKIEVPIPAGCSYEKKETNYYNNEVHREYFKEKVIIFTQRLTKGKHRFKIDLLPRYTGSFSMNPAKVELMYFPTFYGNENLKQVNIN